MGVKDWFPACSSGVPLVDRSPLSSVDQVVGQKREVVAKLLQAVEVLEVVEDLMVRP